MATRDKRIRSKNLTEEERDEQVTVTIRIPADVKFKVGTKAERRHVSQNVQFRDSLELGFALDHMIASVRKCIVRTDPRYGVMGAGEPGMVLPPNTEQERAMYPSDDECLRFISTAVQRAITRQYDEYEHMKEVQGL